MSISWGYSPKIEKYIPLADFPADKYLIIARQAIENLGWKLSHLSENGIIAYTPLSFQSYSEEISIRIIRNFAVVKSECVGIQLLLNDYGKNDSNLEKFFHEFEYVEYHLKDSWDEIRVKFHELVATSDGTYFEKAPLAIKNKIKNVFFLFLPQRGYIVTPILVALNVLYWVLITFVTFVYRQYLLTQAYQTGSKESFVEKIQTLLVYFGVSNKFLVLDGQYWRLISSLFIHGSFSHLFFNMYALIYLGLMAENKLGWKKFLTIYLLSGICGGFISLLFHEVGYIFGASGAVMGVMGALIALLLNKYFEKNASRALLISTVFVTAIIILNGSLSKSTDNATHIAGMIAGFIICYIFSFKLQKQPWQNTQLRYAGVFVLFIAFSFGVAFFTPNYQTQQYKKLRDSFSDNLISFNQLLYLKASLSKEEKLREVNDYGIIPSQNNLQIIKQMKPLKLKDLEAYDRSKKAEIAKKMSLAVALMLRDIQADSVLKYSKQTSKEISNVAELTFKLSDSLSRANQN